MTSSSANDKPGDTGGFSIAHFFAKIVKRSESNPELAAFIYNTQQSLESHIMGHARNTLPMCLVIWSRK
jgi:hypothetical protein